MLSNQFLRIAFITLAVFFAVNCANRPTELNGPIKGKRSLRLANGTPISQPGSDEYNPHLILGPNNYLALIFGSNRSCSGCTGHNIFISMSLTPFNGQTLPFFSAPAVLNQSGTPWINDEFAPVNFAAVLEGSALKVYANVPGSYNMQVTEVSSDGSITTPAAIANSIHLDSTVIGVDSSGQRLLVIADSTYEAYEINPAVSNQGTRLAAIDYAPSAVGVRQENSGLQNSYFASYTDFSFAATKDSFVGPLASLDISLGFSGLYLKTINSFFSTSAANDLVLFTANDGLSDDMYVVTSHTAAQLWSTTGFFGFDQFLPPMPVADLRLEFEYNDSNTGLSAWTASGFTGTFSSDRATGLYSWELNGSSNNVSFPTVNVGDSFAIAAWVKVDSSASSGEHTIATNSANGPVNGFRFFVAPNASDVEIFFETGTGSTPTALQAPGFTFPKNEWHHVAVTVNKTAQFATMYFDGGPIAFGAIDPGFPTSAQLRFGSTNGAATNFFLGKMDDAMIFLRELSSLEVLVLSSVDTYQNPP